MKRENVRVKEATANRCEFTPDGNHAVFDHVCRKWRRCIYEMFITELKAMVGSRTHAKIEYRQLSVT